MPRAVPDNGVWILLVVRDAVVVKLQDERYLARMPGGCRPQKPERRHTWLAPD